MKTKKTPKKGTKKISAKLKSTSSTKAKAKCSACRKQGHNVRTCGSDK